MRTFLNISLAVALAWGLVADCRATGFFGPNEYLQDGGANVAATPEFYWELEVKRLASAFHPVEKRRVEKSDPAEPLDDKAQKESALAEQAAEADEDDFAAALKEGRIKPPDPVRAKEQHDQARELVGFAHAESADPLPAEFESEFAVYHRGAMAYRRGGERLKEARAEWGKLLQLPEAERHYRSVWAAFMIGKAALKMGDPEAVKWFQRARELAKAGFADSLGMAADSYGWEARSEWKQGHPEKAAPLYLTQLALGDESAVVSLKALIPDRDPVEGMLNYGPEADEVTKWNDEQKRTADENTLKALKAAARDPLLRRLVTVHILATASVKGSFSADAKTAETRCARWLAMIKEARVTEMEDAEYLGWLAYNEGRYSDAARWLDAAKKETPAAWWLRSKLERRAGKLNEAAQSMAKAWEATRNEAAYTGWKEGATEGYAAPDSWAFPVEASGDLAALRLERGDFVQALDTLWKAGLWDDAAFVAERVLTLDELKKYVDQQPMPAAATPPSPEEDTGVMGLRYLLGRRCVREDRYDDADPYLPAPYAKILQIYVKALKEGGDEKRPAIERARAWFTAAWLARLDGMELMGTEGAPDSFISRGDFQSTDLAGQQLRGTYDKITYNNGEEKRAAVPIALKVSKEERERLEKNKPNPNIRYHYRVVAAALAMRAAKLLPDNAEELADVVNTAGGWVKDRDEKTADRYYQILEKRCGQTKIGRAAIGKHWFVDEGGPWSAAQQKAYEAMHQELDPK